MIERLGIFAVLRAALIAQPQTATRDQSAASPPWISGTESVFAPGDSGVVPSLPKKGIALPPDFHGTASFEILVNSSGQVSDVKVLNQQPGKLYSKAVDSIRKTQFNVAKKDGKPVAVRIQLNLSSTR